MDNYYFSKNFFVQISDNYFSIYSNETDKTTNIVFAGFRIDEKIFNEENNDYFNGDSLLLGKKEIKINETGKLHIYPINKQKCGIVFNYTNYYICKLPNTEIIVKIEMKFKDVLFLLKFVEEGKDKYRFYLNDRKTLFYIA